jgi:hypothetical protein
VPPRLRDLLDYALPYLGGKLAQLLRGEPLQIGWLCDLFESYFSSPSTLRQVAPEAW